MFWFPRCLGSCSVPSWQPVQAALRWVFWGDAHAGGSSHLHGLWHPDHLRLLPRLPPPLEDRKVLHRQGEGGTKGERSHRQNVVIYQKNAKYTTNRPNQSRNEHTYVIELSLASVITMLCNMSNCFYNDWNVIPVLVAQWQWREKNCVSDVEWYWFGRLSSNYTSEWRNISSNNCKTDLIHLLFCWTG